MESSTSEATLELEYTFQQIIEGRPVTFEITILNDILSKSLDVNLASLKPRLRYILPYMLVHFITTWPGWKKTSQYHDKQMTFENWYKRFKEYLIFKINFITKTDYDKAATMLRCNSPEFEAKLVKMTDCSVQTNPYVDKTIAPFSIEISGPAKVLNSLVFCEAPDDDDDTVVIKQYKSNLSWGPPLSTRQIINWPWIEVEFYSKYLNFKRTNKHEFKRCLTFSSENIFLKKSDSHIEEIDIIDEKAPREAYTLNAIKEFCKVYINFLRFSLKLADKIQKEIEVILEDFILDIVDINMNSMATNTSVNYNIGNGSYARNISAKASSVCFGECLTPKLTTSLYSFTGIKNRKVIPFDMVSSSTLIDLCPITIFRCTFCNKSCPNSSEIWEHLQSSHNMEQPVLCFSCNKQFMISNLTENRWFHDCHSIIFAP